jgi:HK97 gp10 family phage protein
MADTNITIDGLAAVDEHLAALSREAARKIARNALRKGGEVMRDAIMERAPERPDLPSGTALPVGALAADIRMGATTDDGGNPSEWVGPGKFTSHAARWVEYGHRQVKGGRSRLLKSGKTRGPGKEMGEPVPAHPFIRPAYEATAEKTIEVMVESLVADVEKSAGGSSVVDSSGEVA